ncbi:protein SMAX1-LIKE 6 isoform X2 [Cicer arietinum]|uniref:Protein SMAX1-LIKE 6 isoform X2 n=1 Tax=Cicer arietinum TaxID=3827 RepID=A0A1S2Y7W5_CICAR|nr:protein SMAX1-LIKE 6 isoform X2 [Cicer arietinum]
MPTPVSTARQCLTDEAARALDDAVSVARRRSHAQTTSLHAISALLSLPSNALRDACARVGTSPYSPRLQFRALELSVGVSLDRLPTTKSSAAVVNDGVGPPVSNSLMAAIKRSQANQRRHPDSFHLLQIMQQQQQQNQTASFLKVELKHFILSILDDPIVSRVFAEAGFRSYDIKFALLQPPPPSRFFHRSNPPVFLIEPDPVRFDENSRRIVEVIVRKSKRNPLLMGVYAKTALKRFIEFFQSGKFGFLPMELDGLSVVSIEKEIFEFLVGGESEEKMGLRFDEVGRLIDQCLGSGVVVSFGEIEVFMKNDGDGDGDDGLGFVVSKLTRLLEVYGGKVWLIGVAGTSDVYSKFLRLFPTIDKDWDLHLLTVTSATTSSMEGLYSKSSLMGSFVPFGGFFSTPSDFRNPINCTNSSLVALCDTCNEKYEQEVADNVKVGPSTSSPTSLPWLQKTNEDNTSLNTTIFGLQRKWSDICQHLHQNKSLPEINVSQTLTRFQAPFHEGFQFGRGTCNKALSLDEIHRSNPIPYMSKELQTSFSSKHILPVSSLPFDTTLSVNDKTEHVAKVAKCDQKSSSSLTPVTTDLVLGTTYASATRDEPDTPKLSDHKKHLHHLSDSLSTDFDAVNENTSNQIARSSSYSCPNLEGKFETVDFKSLYKLLTEKVWWQDEAIYSIIRTMTLCKSSAGKRSGSNVRADTWFSFLGLDRVGKRKIASALAETLFGSKQSLISVDLNSRDRFQPLDSIFECHDVLRRKTVVDYIAGELSKKPHSVVFLENIDKADLLVQNSLFQSIKTGKFPYSHGREISINNVIFVVTSSVFKDCGFFEVEKETKMFPEERILEAKRCQMQLSLGHASEDAKRSSSRNVSVAMRKGTLKHSFLNKRKLVESGDSNEKVTCKTPKHVVEASRSYLDLNMPLEEVEDTDYDDCEKESVVQNHEAWLNDFIEQIDGKVVFKPFNFDFLAEQVIECIDKQFQRTFGSEFQLEIDYEVMSQILAAAWLSDKKKAVEDWIEHVLGNSFAEAQKKYHHANEYVMKLVKCENIFVEEQALEVCLPARINLN